MFRTTAGRVTPIRSRHPRSRIVQTGAAALAMGLLLAACGSTGGSSGDGEGGDDPVVMRIASAPTDVYLMDEFALSKGLFADHNLKVDKFIYPQSGVQGSQLLASGAVDAMQQDTLLTMASFANGQKGKRPIIVGMRMPTVTYAIITRDGFEGPGADASFEERMKALEGKTIGVTAIGAGADQQLTLALEEAGMDKDSVTRLAVGQMPPMIAQLKSKRVDAVVSQTWASSRMMEAATGGSIYVEYADPSLPEIVSGQEVGPLVVREDFLEKNPEAVKDYLELQTATKKEMLDHPDEAAKFLNKNTFDGKAADLSAAYVDDWSKNVITKADPDWRMSREAFDRMVEVGVRIGLLKEGQVTYEDMVADFAQES